MTHSTQRPIHSRLNAPDTAPRTPAPVAIVIRTRRCRVLIVFSRADGVAIVPETAILARIAEGDKAAVGECLDRYGGLVWSLARQFLGNEPDAEDAVQDIFIAVWSSAARYDPAIASEVTFIATIARRRLIDHVRRSGRRVATDSLDDESATPIQPRVAARLEESAEVARVERVLREMPDQHRSILSMSLYEGYSHSEIADRLELPLGTVKTRVRRGLISIREQLRLGDDDERDAVG